MVIFLVNFTVFSITDFNESFFFLFKNIFLTSFQLGLSGCSDKWNRRVFAVGSQKTVEGESVTGPSHRPSSSVYVNFGVFE